jgi:hypothetical protein
MVGTLSALVGPKVAAAAALAGAGSLAASAGAGSLAASALMAHPAALSGAGTLAATTLKAVAFDAVGAGNNGTSTTPTWAHTIAGNCLVIGGWFYAHGSPGTVSATCGGVTVPLLLYQPDGGGSTPYGSALFVLRNPPIGSGQSIVVTVPGGGNYASAFNSVSYFGVNSVGSAVSNYGTGAALSSGAVASALGHRVVDILGAANAGTLLTGYNQTQRYSSIAISGTSAALLGDAPGAASVNFAANDAAAYAWSSIAVDLSP